MKRAFARAYKKRALIAMIARVESAGGCHAVNNRGSQAGSSNWQSGLSSRSLRFFQRCKRHVDPECLFGSTSAAWRRPNRECSRGGKPQARHADIVILQSTARREDS